MPEVAELWEQVVPEVRKGVTGIVIWTALKTAVPVAFQEAEMAKMKAELLVRTSWEQIYERISREFAAVPNRSLPQNRARFFDAACAIVADARKEQTEYDDSNERSFARCLERIAQYTEIPSTLVAQEVLKRSGEI